MKTKLPLILFFIAFTITDSCKKKEPAGPSIYIFKVIDEYTNGPIPDCHVVLSTSYCTQSRIDTLGLTNPDGTFEFNVDDRLSHEILNNAYYEMSFSKIGYSKYLFHPFELNNEINNINIELNKFATHCVIAINTSGLNLSVWYSCAPSFDLYNHVYDKPIGDTSYMYNKIPSNTSISFKWAYSYGPYNYSTFQSSYNDTTYMTISY